MRFFAMFGYAWFTIGLFTGTLVLVIAVRGILYVVHRLGWEQSTQNRLLICVILLFVVGSFLLARHVVRSLYHQTPTTRKMALFALAIPALLSGYAWSNPARFLPQFAGTEVSSLSMKRGPNFVFGSYPTTGGLKSAAGFERKTAPFERGMLMKVSDGIWVIPYPNEAEFHGFLEQGQPGHVLLALDPTDTLQRVWIAKAVQQMRQYAVPYTLLSYPGANHDTNTAAILAQMKTRTAPFTVIVPATGQKVGMPVDPLARAIAKAYGVTIQPPTTVAQRTVGETPELMPAPPPMPMPGAKPLVKAP